MHCTSMGQYASTIVKGRIGQDSSCRCTGYAYIALSLSPPLCHMHIKPQCDPDFENFVVSTMRDIQNAGF